MESRASRRNLYIRTSQDALVVYEAARLQHIPILSSNLLKTECEAIKAGDVFVWCKASSLDDRRGVLRWADGKKWGPSRQSFGLTLADEMDSDRRPKTGPDALVRIVHRVLLNSNNSPSLDDDDEHGSYHLVAYQLRSGDSTFMNDVSSDPLLASITVPEKLYIQPNQARPRRSVGRRSSIAPGMRTPSGTPAPSLPPITPEGHPLPRSTTTPMNLGTEHPSQGQPGTLKSPAPFSVPHPGRLSVDVPTPSGFTSRIPVPSRLARPQPASTASTSKMEPIQAAKPQIMHRSRTFRVEGQTHHFNYFSSFHEYPLPFGPPEIPQALLSGNGAEALAVQDGDVYIHEHTLNTGEDTSFSCWLRINNVWETASEGSEHPGHPSMRLRIRSDKTPGWVTVGSFNVYKSVEKKRKRDEMEGTEQDSPQENQGNLLVPPPETAEELHSASLEPIAPMENNENKTAVVKVEPEADDDGLLLPPAKRARADDTSEHSQLPSGGRPQHLSRKRHGRHGSTSANSRGLIGWAKGLFRWKR